MVEYNSINPLSAEEFCNRVRDDLVARGVCEANEVFYGDWEPPRKGKVNPEVKPRIIFSLAGGAFSFQEGGFQNFPGGAYNYTIGSPAPIYNARSLWTVIETITVTIDAATEIQRGDNSALTAQRKAIILRNQVLAAIYRVCPGSITPMGGQWMDAPNAEFKYGSRIQFQFGLQIPILDDPSILITYFEQQAGMYLNETLDGYITLDGYV